MKQMAAFLFAFLSLAVAQSPIDELMREGVKQTEDGWALFDKQTLMSARSNFERAINAEPENKYAMYYLAYSEYRLLTYAFSRKHNEMFDQLVDSAVEHCKKAIELGSDWSEPKALLSGIYGYKIAKNWMSAMTLGPKADGLTEEALEKNPNNPRVLLFRGISFFNKPSMFGGSVDKAQADFKKSVEEFELQKKTESLEPMWGYTDALAWLGKAYEKKEMNDKAIEVYKKALVVNPNFSWIKNVLLPNLEKKMVAK